MSMPMSTSAALAARGRAPSEVRAQSRYVSFGPFQVDLQREELFKDGARVHIPSKVYHALLALVERPGEIVTRDDLRARLWPAGTFVNYDANVNTTVNKLRLALGDSPDQPVYVETIPRQGYSFVGTVERRTEFAKNPDGKGVVCSTEAIPTRGVSVAPAATNLKGGLAGFFASGWAAAIVLCGVLLGIGIVLFTHRPS